MEPRTATTNTNPKPASAGLKNIPHEIPPKDFLWNYGFNTLFRIARIGLRFRWSITLRLHFSIASNVDFFMLFDVHLCSLPK